VLIWHLDAEAPQAGLFYGNEQGLSGVAPADLMIFGGTIWTVEKDGRRRGKGGIVGDGNFEVKLINGFYGTGITQISEAFGGALFSINT
jgi:hypothetical protein